MNGKFVDIVFGVGSKFRCERSAAPAEQAASCKLQARGICAPTPKTPAPEFSQPFVLRCGRIGLSLSKPCVDSRRVRSADFRCRSVAAAGDLLFFASPKESKPRKGDPTVCVPPLRYGQPAVFAPAGVELELASLKQSLALFRLDLRSSAHTKGFSETGSDSEPNGSDVVATVFIAACARFAWASGQKNLQNRRIAWFLGADRNFAVFIVEVMREWLPVLLNVGVERRPANRAGGKRRPAAGRSCRTTC